MLEYKLFKTRNGSDWNDISFSDFFQKQKEFYGNDFLDAYVAAFYLIKDNRYLNRVTTKTNTLSDIALFLALCEVNGLPVEKAERLIASMINVPNILTALDISHAGSIGASHYPGVYLAWMSLDEADAFGRINSWVFSLHCPIDITVYNAEGTCVAEIVNHEVVFSDIPVVVDGESTEFYLDESPETYRIEIHPTDIGEMTYCITELDDQELVRRINYLNIPVEPGQEYSGSILATVDYTDGMYDLTCVQNGTETPVPADEVISEDAPLQMVVEDGPGGTTTGSGNYYRGDSATLRAYPDDEYEFTGWYRDGVLLSAEPVYRIEMKEDVTVQATFGPTTCSHIWGGETVVEIPGIDDMIIFTYRCDKCGLIHTECCSECAFADVKSSNWFYKPVLWAIYKAITKCADATHFAPNQTCTRGQVVTFLYNTLAE